MTDTKRKEPRKSAAVRKVYVAPSLVAGPKLTNVVAIVSIA
jgi:hypothetical protein